jgi:uroporphyrinogen decarboxylase
MAGMTSRERVLAALNHQEPDWVPMALGSSNSTSLSAGAYENLKRYLGLESEPRFLAGQAIGTAIIDEPVLQLLGSDVRGIFDHPLPDRCEIWEGKEVLIDAWGIARQKCSSTDSYYIIRHPLQDATLDDLERYPWPDPQDPARVEGLATQAKSLREDTDFAVMGSPWLLSLFEKATYLRGMEQLLVDLLLNPAFAQALLGQLVELSKEQLALFLEAVGPYIDIIRIGDDVSSQHGPLMSPDLYRQMVKPYEKELITFIKERTEAKVYFHCCGNVYPLIDDFIDIGVDILDPIQVSAKDMGNTARLKQEFGDRICFCGAIDTQYVLPFGTPEEVEAEVKRRIRDLAPGGGYLLAPVHTVQPDVPPENIIAMCQAGQKHGYYPIT